MKLELIYTFENGQDFLIKEIPETFLKAKEKLSEYLTRGVPDNNKNNLVKISCCAIGVTKKDLPDWFLEANGKLYFN